MRKETPPSSSLRKICLDLCARKRFAHFSCHYVTQQIQKQIQDSHKIRLDLWLQGNTFHSIAQHFPQSGNDKTKRTYRQFFKSQLNIKMQMKWDTCASGIWSWVWGGWGDAHCAQAVSGRAAFDDHSELQLSGLALDGSSSALLDDVGWKRIWVDGGGWLAVRLHWLD